MMRVEFYDCGKKKIFENVTSLHEIVSKGSDGDTDMIMMEYYEPVASHWVKCVQKVDVTLTSDWKMFPEWDSEEV